MKVGKDLNGGKREEYAHTVAKVNAGIALIAYALNPNRGSEAGIASAWLNIIEKHFSVDVFTDAAHKHDLEKNKYPNTRFHFIEGMKKWRRLVRLTGFSPLVGIVFFRKVKKALEASSLSEYALIHCLTPAGIHSFNDIHKLGVPVIIGPLGGGLPTPKNFPKVFKRQPIKSFLRDKFYDRLLKTTKWRQYVDNSQLIIVGTPDVRQLLPKEVHNKSITIFDTVVDVDTYSPNLDKQQKDNVNVLFAGSLESKKGVLLLIEAISLCVRQGIRNFHVSIAGEGPLYREAKTLIRKYGLSQNVSLLGRLSKTDLIVQYRSADIFCLPTLREPGGTAILEAMASGLPIITSNYGGPSYSVSDECGIKIEVQNEMQYGSDLSAALQQLITEPDVRAKMGKAARQRAVSEYSLAALEKKIYSLYNEILNEQAFAGESMKRPFVEVI